MESTSNKSANAVDAELSAIPRSVSDIARSADVSRTTTRRALIELADSGRARRLDDGKWVRAEDDVAKAIAKAIDESDVPAKAAARNRTKAQASPATSGMIEGGGEGKPSGEIVEKTNDAVVVAVNGNYDVMAARDEWRALKQWEKDGRNGDRPDSTNFDALNAAHASGRPRSNGAKSNGNGKPRSKRSPRGLEALERQKSLNNKRGKGRKVTDEELTEHIRQARKAHPESSCYDEEEFAYWIEGMSLGIERWNKVWASLDSEFVVEPKEESKPK